MNFKNKKKYKKLTIRLILQIIYHVFLAQKENQYNLFNIE
jgi:hypothetical protein